MEDIFASEDELGRAPIVWKKEEARRWGTIEINIAPQLIYVKALAKNGLYLNFAIEEVRLLKGKYTAVLKPIDFRKTPWKITRRFREDINLDYVVIPERYKEELERMLEVEEVPVTSGKGGSRQRGRGEHLPMREYFLPLLESLAEMGGKGRAKGVIDKVYEKLKNRLTDVDKEYVPSGTDIRWKNIVRSVHYELVNRGYLRRDSPIGVWELTDKGWEYLRELKRQST